MTEVRLRVLTEGICCNRVVLCYGLHLFSAPLTVIMVARRSSQRYTGDSCILRCSQMEASPLSFRFLSGFTFHNSLCFVFISVLFFSFFLFFCGVFTPIDVRCSKFCCCDICIDWVKVICAKYRMQY